MILGDSTDVMRTRGQACSSNLILSVRGRGGQELNQGHPVYTW